MSIFSKLLKRGPEDGPSSGDGDAPAAPQASPAARAPAPAPAKATRPSPASNDKSGAPQPAQKMQQTRSYAAPATRPPTGRHRTLAAGAAPAAAAARPTPARVVPPNGAAVPAPRPAATPAAARPASAVPKERPPADGSGTIEMEAMPAVGSIDQAFDQLLGQPPQAPAAGVSTESDLRAVMATFEALAVGHSAEVRSLMMEVRWGEAQTSWFELARPALKSLRAMSGQVGHDALTAALDGFGAAVDELLRPGAAPTVGPAQRDKLLAAYAPLVATLPAAFELQGERDRREPIVVRALLAQVPGLEPLMVDKLMAAGLTRLEALFQARADEVAAVTGLPGDLASAIVARVQAWKRATPAALATPDRAGTARELGALVEALETQHAGFEEASRGWSERDQQAKRRLRRERETTFLQITIVLARLGEVDLALALERCSFARRLEELTRLQTRLPRAAADNQLRKSEREAQSGANAAP